MQTIVNCADHFLDMNVFETSEQLDFATDASGTIGFGGFFNGKWVFWKLVSEIFDF